MTIRIRYLRRTHFFCRDCGIRTWANELAPDLRKKLCPACFHKSAGGKR